MPLHIELYHIVPSDTEVIKYSCHELLGNVVIPVVYYFGAIVTPFSESAAGILIEN